jgi:hypothetical protein
VASALFLRHACIGVSTKRLIPAALFR